MAYGFKTRKWYGLCRNGMKANGQMGKVVMVILPGFDDDIPTKEEFYLQGELINLHSSDEIVELKLVVKKVVS